jgi:hypothetical protein
VTRCLLAAAVAIAVLAPGAVARADGDPPSDVLLAQDVYFPYTPATSDGMARALLTLTRRTRADGWPIKVAIVATPNDLGSLADLFGKPQAYIDILSQEIDRPRLLVVMAAGFAGKRLGASADRVLTAVRTPATGGDPLANEAFTAVARLAAAAGHRVRIPPIDTSARGRRPYRGTVNIHQSAPAVARPGSGATRRSKGGGASPLLVFGAPIALIMIALAVLTVRERRSSL